MKILDLDKFDSPSVTFKGKEHMLVEPTLNNGALFTKLFAEFKTVSEEYFAAQAEKPMSEEEETVYWGKLKELAAKFFVDVPEELSEMNTVQLVKLSNAVQSMFMGIASDVSEEEKKTLE